MQADRKPNHLIHEKSPYLLQHAYNPVDWYAWGDEAFEKARTEDKIILLSIGYSTCHWCHVMEKESFEDDKTAEILNRHFVAIKLDREERPDIDKLYMDALHAMGQQGGWPLNLFLTPNKEPILGGTYFPPENRYGRKGFKEVLLLVEQAWRNQREELVQAAADLADYLRNSEKTEEGSELPDKDVFERTVSTYKKVYDPNFFGFKMNQQNKFPPSMALSFLVHYHHFFRDEAALEIAFNTAYAMKSGGIYDQIGGGLCRYSTDHEWLVPHFEKMLYDNSLFLSALSGLFIATGHSFLAESIEDIVHYIRRDMSLSQGGIASAEDADSEGEEGKFYVWSEKEFDSLVADEEIKNYWNVTEEGNFEEKNILNIYFSGKNPYRDNISLTETFQEKLKLKRQILLDERSKRIRPLRDDKVITAWNCLYIKALVQCFRATNNETYLKDALHVYHFLLSHLRDKNGFLFRRYREKEARFPGNLTDYAEFVMASLMLFQETMSSQFFHTAMETLNIIETHFASPAGAYYESISTNNDLIVRSIEGYDGVEPSGNSTLAHVFLLLSGLGIEPSKHWDKAGKIFSYFWKEINTNSLSYPSMLDAYLIWSKGLVEVAVIYKQDHIEDVKEILDGLHSHSYPNVAWVIMEEEHAKHLSSEIPLLQGRGAGDTHLVYVCKNLACAAPVTGWEATKQLITQSL